MGDFIDEVKSNPLVLAILAIVLFAIIYFVHKKIAAPTSTAVVSPLVNATGTPTVYNNTYNTYPTVEPPPTKVVPPIVDSTCKPGYHFVSMVDNPHYDKKMDKGSYTISGGFCVPDKTTITPTPVPIGPPVHVPPTGPPVPIIPTPVTPPTKYVTVTPWPSQLSTLWGIAQSQGKTLSYIESLNRLPNPNLIYPGQKIRVS